MARTFRINTEYITNFPKEVDVLAFMYYLKNNFANSALYNYSSRIISQKLGLSHNVVNKYINQMKGLGWVVEEHGHIRIKSLKHIFNEYERGRSVVLPFLKKQTLTEIKRMLQGAVIINNLIQQSWWVQQKSNLNNATISLNTYKKVKKKYGERINKKLQTKLSISNERISQLLSVSNSCASTIIKFLEEKNFLKKKITLNVLGTCPRKQFAKIKGEFPSCFISNKGVIFKRLANSYDLNPKLFPVSC